MNVRTRANEAMGVDMGTRPLILRVAMLFGVIMASLLGTTSAQSTGTCANRTTTKSLEVVLRQGETVEVAPGVLALFGSDVGQSGAVGPYIAERANIALDTYGCTASAVPDSFQGGVLVVTRGECEFITKARVAQAAGAKALIIVSTGEEFTTMTCNTDEEVSIIVAMVAGRSGEAIWESTASSEKTTIMIDATAAVPSSFDFVASTALVGMALLTIVLGGVWSLKDKRYAGISKGSSSQGGIGDDSSTHEGVEINEYSALYFVIMASVVLLVLFYSMQHWIFVAMRLIFAFASFQGLQVIIFEGFASVRGASNSRENHVLLPVLGAVHHLSIPAGIVAGLIVSTWLIFQTAAWSWVLQNIMGLSFLVNILRLVHLPNLKVATFLLGGAMLYDIFWVYVQPHLFGKKSVMVAVARGGDEGESLPMLFLFPRLSHSGEFSMLGFGDVILPGLLIVHNLLFDNRKRDFGEINYYYFFWSLLAYAVGMSLTFTALYFEVGGQGGQPALTYLVPTVVGTSMLLGWKHGNLGEMWNGHDGYDVLPSETQSML